MKVSCFNLKSLKAFRLKIIFRLYPGKNHRMQSEETRKIRVVGTAIIKTI